MAGPYIRARRVSVTQEFEMKPGAKFLTREGEDIATVLDHLKVFSTAELSAIDGVTAGTAAAGKAVVLNSAKHIDEVNTAKLSLGATGAVTEVTATAAELNYLDRAGAVGLAEASKAVVLDAAKHLDEVNTAKLSLGATGAVTEVTATAAELNYLDRAGAVGLAEASKAVVLDANKHLDEVNTAKLSLGATGAAVEVTATAAELNTLAGSAAGIAAVLAGGLGGSVAQAKTANGVTEVVAAHGTKDRAVLVVAVVTETFADGDGAQPTFQIGEDGTAAKFFDTAAFTDAAAGTVLMTTGTNDATENLRVTAVAASGSTSTGALTVTMIAIPTT